MPQTIMIAANDPNITYLLQRYAEESGFQTICASAESDVLPLAHRTHPALIILDFDLPDAASRKMLHRLRTEANTCQIPIVIYSEQDELPEDWDEGVAGYLPKSVLYDDFVAVLEHTGVHN